MRIADIKTDRVTQYAVKLPNIRYGRRDGLTVECAVMEDRGVSPHAHVQGYVLGRPGGKWEQGGSEFSVPCSAVVSTWADYVFSLDWEEALREDNRREFAVEAEQKRAEAQADVEGWCHLFEGLPCEGFSTRTVNEPTDMGQAIHDMFVRMGSQTITLRRADMRAIAKRISDLQQAVLASGGGWATGAEPVLDGQREVVTLRPTASSSLAALEATLTAAESEGE